MRDRAFDAEFAEALARVELSEGLREKVIGAMEHTAKVERGSFGWKRFGIPLAAAAGIALAFIFVDGKQDDGLA